MRPNGGTWLMALACAAMGAPAKASESRGTDWDDRTTLAEEGEYRIGATLVGLSFAALAPLEPGWRVGGALGLGFSLEKSWTTIDEIHPSEMWDLLRADVLVSYTLGKHAWMDFGAAAAITAILGLDGRPDYKEIGYSGVLFAEPLFGWHALRFGTRLGAGYWISGDRQEAEEIRHAGLVLYWTPITLKIVW